MYAVIEQGGKQYKVEQGESLDIELTAVAPDAKNIELDKVLLISDGQDSKSAPRTSKAQRLSLHSRPRHRKRLLRARRFRSSTSAGAKITTRKPAIARNTSALPSTKSNPKQS